MKKEELRIGNWYLNDCDDKPIQLTAENILTAIKDEDWLQPLTLTEEWLERFGFRIHSDYSYRNFILPRNKFMISMWMSDGKAAGFEETGVCYWGDIYLPVRTVHHLQNLYYCLTGTELVIKD